MSSFYSVIIAGDSKDSRAFGSVVARDAIAGRVWYCHAPKRRRGILR